MPLAKDSFYLNFFLDDPLVLGRGWALEARLQSLGLWGVVLPERDLADHLSPDGKLDLYLAGCQ